mmetsp:Transcript_18101/g.30905  ORF Transcript_18101/g.30905 Transcript_18101/m.30905 type:complete len:186 (+) Transcript_18101:923-1480(+)
MDLISSLIDIQIAFKAASGSLSKSRKQMAGSKRDSKGKVACLPPNPIDSKFEQLKCEMTALDPCHPDFKVIEQYVNNTKDYNKVKIEDVFKLSREGEESTFNPLKLDNQKLLWHGSRFSNFVGIISQGLRIAPPEAPKSGYLYGKGVYFADFFSKSAPYCRAYLSEGTAILLLCQVALGNPIVKK